MTNGLAIVVPEWSRPMLITGLAFAFVGLLADTYPVSPTAQGRIYWAGWGLATLLLTASVAHDGWRTAVLVMAVLVFIAVLLAYFRTSHLKIGGRIRSPYIARTGETPPPDAYRGNVLPSTAWWAAAVFAVAGGGFVFMADSPSDNGFVIACGAITSLYLAGLGHLDKADGFPVARTQYVPLAVTVAACIPLLLLPVAAYFAAYWASPRKSDANEDSREAP
ncbi:hypothetical protein [Mycolicibacterium mengxianglii]|uniref:hypothetical protein n=1 Tax=Mycolicibacterium mengxianglii TaxID=2736649 RepID=UPI0018EEDEAA|nr:hypothetical protein [Mycolicibacterium mengxianglii]